MKNIFLILILFIFSCSGTETYDITSNKSEDKVVVDSLVKVDSFNLKYDFITSLTNNIIPYTDTTNFDNFSSQKQLTKKQFEFFKLKTILHNPKFADFVFVELRHRIHYSDNFLTLVFTTQFGQHELRTDLVNYDIDLNVIDCLTISYDEIAESCMKKTSVLTDKELIINDFNFCTDKKTLRSERFRIAKNGKIIKIQ